MQEGIISANSVKSRQLKPAGIQNILLLIVGQVQGHLKALSKTLKAKIQSTISFAPAIKGIDKFVPFISTDCLFNHSQIL